MRTVPFKQIFDRTIRMYGRDPRTNVNSDLGNALIEHINNRVRLICQCWRWPEWEITEERAFRQVWRDDHQYLRVSLADGKPDEVFYLGAAFVAGGGFTTGFGYYRVKASASGDPPIGTLPTNTTYFEAISPLKSFISYDQGCKRAIGIVRGVYSSNPSFSGNGMLKYLPSERGVDVMGSGNSTVFLTYSMPVPRFTMTPWVAGKTYARADIVFDSGTGECFQALTSTSNAVSNAADWRRIPFPDKWESYVCNGAFADSLMEFDQGGNADLQAKMVLAQAASERADNSLQSEIDALTVQGQKLQYNKCGSSSCVCETLAFTGGTVTTLTDVCDDEFGWVYPPTPAPIPLPDDTQSGIAALVNGQNYVDVVFGTPQPNADWTFLETLIINTIDASALNIWPGIVTSKTTTGFRLQLNGTPDSDNYYLSWTIVGVPPTPATSYTLSGPSGGDVGVASTPFTVQLPSGQTVPLPVTVTPSDGGGGGTFAPATVTLTTGAPLATFTYTPASSGAKTISVTNNRSLSNPANLTYTAASVLHLLTNLISYWKMDEASGTRNDSQGTNHLAAVNAPGSAAGKINNGVVFVGASSQGLQIANNASLQVTGDFTFSLWIKLTSQPGVIYVLAKVAPALDYELVYDPGGVGFECCVGAASANSDFAQQGATVANGVWTHIVFWYDSVDHQIHMRINDANSYASTTSPALVQNTSPFFIGGGNTLFSNSTIDEVGFWKRKLSAAEITALYNGGAAAAFSTFTT